MKTLFTLVIVLFFGATSSAQNFNNDAKVETFKMGIVLDSSPSDTVADFETSYGKQREVARLYKFKNSRVKKALSFATKKSKPKMA